MQRNVREIMKTELLRPGSLHTADSSAAAPTAEKKSASTREEALIKLRDAGDRSI